MRIEPAGDCRGLLASGLEETNSTGVMESDVVVVDSSSSSAAAASRSEGGDALRSFSSFSLL
jgi:hypothetical protein